MSTEKTEIIYFIKELIEKFIFPFLVAVTSYILLNRLSVWRERKDKSRLGVAILDALIEEVSNGVKIMEETPNLQNRPTTLLPKKSWNGMNTIPDDILLILLRISNDIPPKGFLIRDIRIHCKNYFDHMTNTWENQVTKDPNWKVNSINLINNGKFVEAGNKVIEMLKQAKELLEKNSKKKIPK